VFPAASSRHHPGHRCEQGHHIGIGDPVENGLALSPGLDDAVAPQAGQMLGQGRLGKSNHAGDLSNRALAVSQGAQHLQAMGIG
jgi:hypothetical protein